MSVHLFVSVHYTCHWIVYNIGFTISQATRALRESRGIDLLYLLTSALEGGEGSASRPGRTLPPGKTRYPLYRKLGGPQGWSGQVRKISPPPGFDPQTVQPVGSRYTDYATRPTVHYLICSKNFQNSKRGLSYRVNGSTAQDCIIIINNYNLNKLVQLWSLYVCTDYENLTLSHQYIENKSTVITILSTLHSSTLNTL